MLLLDKMRICRYFRRPISGPSEPETPDDGRLREIKVLLLQNTPFHPQGVASEAFQFKITGLVILRFLERARRARPSKLRLCRYPAEGVPALTAPRIKHCVVIK
jgi:hypothetical protein